MKIFKTLDMTNFIFESVFDPNFNFLNVKKFQNLIPQNHGKIKAFLNAIQIKLKI